MLWRLEAVSPEQMESPIGIIFVKKICFKSRPKDKDLRESWFVMSSWVLPIFRRQGLRSRMNDELFKHATHILSGASSEEGLSFMRKAGYKLDRFSGLWVLKKPRGKQ